jgi:hypothetical protein
MPNLDANEDASDYSGFWITMIIFGAVGVIFNVCALLLFSNVEVRRRPKSYDLIRILMMSDFTFSICVLAFNSAYYNNSGIVNDAACQIQAISLELFFILSGSTHAVIARLMYLDVCHSVKATFRVKATSVMLAICYATMCATLSILLPYTGYEPLSSGTWCITRIYRPLAFIMLMGLGCGVPPMIMGYSYYQIYANVLEGREILREQGITNVTVKAAVVDEVKKMCLFVLSFYAAAMPFMCVPLYRWITGDETPPIYDLISSPPAIFLLCVMDPCLLVYLNVPTRELFMEIMSKIFVCFANQVFIGISEATTTQRRRAPCDFENWEEWMEHEDLYTAFEAHSTKNYVQENVLFCRDVLAYQQLAGHIAKKFDSRSGAVCRDPNPTIPEDSDEVERNDDVTSFKNSIPLGNNHVADISSISSLLASTDISIQTQRTQEEDDLIVTPEEWGNVFNSANNIFSVYIKVPTAPLEVNIPDSTNKAIRKILGSCDAPSSTRWSIKGSIRSGGGSQIVAGSKRGASINPFIPVGVLLDQHLSGVPVGNHKSASAYVHDISYVFDAANKIIGDVIKSDVFPRFRKSPEFAAAVVEFNKC